MPELAFQRAIGPVRKMKIISQILVIAIINLSCASSYAWVDTTATTVALHKKSVTQVFRQQLLDLTNRQDIVDRLIEYGVSKEEAVLRINSLTDEEIEMYLAKIEELPSGGRPLSSLEKLFGLIMYSPLLAVFYPAFVITTVTKTFVCLAHLSDYSNCFVNNAGMFGSTYPVVKKDFKPVSCLAPCYYDLNDCMESSDGVAEENRCLDMKALCVQKC